MKDLERLPREVTVESSHEVWVGFKHRKTEGRGQEDGIERGQEWEGGGTGLGLLSRPS